VGARSDRTRANPFVIALVFVFAFAADAGLRVLEGLLSTTVGRLYWDGGVNLFYAVTAQSLVSRIHSAFALVLYLAAPIALVAGMGQPLWAKLRYRRRGPGRLASFARSRPILVGKVLPWTASAAWLVAGSLFALVAAAYDGRRGGWRLDHVGRELGRLATQWTNLGYLAGSIAGMLGIATAVHYATRLLTQEDGSPTPEKPTGSEGEEIRTYAAVAVTPATQGAVAGLTAVSLVAVVCAATLHSNEGLAAVVFAYVLSAMGSATLFRRVSRVTIGIDGVLVLGADKARFFGYADLDAAVARGTDVLLKRGGKTALRLQLHEADVARAPELAARIDRARERAMEMQRQGADRLVRATAATREGSERLASSARGGLDYRQPALAREQLWEVVEGPASNVDARRVAAVALLEQLSGEDRARLRVAAERCAEPRAREALADVLEEYPEERPARLVSRR
jgi:hypothetical protein